MAAEPVLLIIFTGIFAAAYSRSIGIIILKFIGGGTALIQPDPVCSKVNEGDVPHNY